MHGHLTPAVPHPPTNMRLWYWCKGSEIVQINAWLNFLWRNLSVKIANLGTSFGWERHMIRTAFVSVPWLMRPSFHVLIQKVQRKALDILNTVGLSNSVLKLIERRHRVDIWIKYVGMVVTLIIVIAFWRWTRWVSRCIELIILLYSNMFTSPRVYCFPVSRLNCLPRRT